eukprot:15475962-Alexandrium_andersonii.AAC.1
MLGPAQFKLRTPDAVLHVRHFELRTLVGWSQRWQTWWLEPERGRAEASRTATCLLIAAGA